jgi:hypothetical protein
MVLNMGKFASVVVSYRFDQDVIFEVSLCHLGSLVFIDTDLTVHSFKLAYITGLS